MPKKLTKQLVTPHKFLEIDKEINNGMTHSVKMSEMMSMRYSKRKKTPVIRVLVRLISHELHLSVLVILKQELEEKERKSFNYFSFKCWGAVDRHLFSQSHYWWSF